jgi:ABC-2 type transport system ATP-binding protein
MGHKKLTVDLQDEINEIPSSLEKYKLEIRK